MRHFVWNVGSKRFYSRNLLSFQYRVAATCDRNRKQTQVLTSAPASLMILLVLWAIFSLDCINAINTSPTKIESYHVFEYFRSGSLFLGLFNCTKSNTTLIDKIASLDHFDSLVPRRWTRIEFEDAEGCEEVRVVNGRNGDFWVAERDVSKAIIQRIHHENEQLYRHCSTELSRSIFGKDLECEKPFWTHVIMYDFHANRIYPAIRHMATFDKLKDMEAAVDRREVSGGIWYTHLDSKAIANVARHTGDYWVGIGEVARILEDRFDEAVREQEKHDSGRPARRRRGTE